jgi:hypothetical protein
MPEIHSAINTPYHLQDLFLLKLYRDIIIAFYEMTTKPKEKLLTKIMFLAPPRIFLKKNTVYFMLVYLSARPSVRIENIRSQWMIFDENNWHLI